jgi:hypothetical protein
MNKFQVLKALRANGDSTVDFKNAPSVVATIDFSEKYIRAKRYGRFDIKKNHILMFSWTDDKFISIEADTIKAVKALSLTLANKGDS